MEESEISQSNNSEAYIEDTNSFCPSNIESNPPIKTTRRFSPESIVDLTVQSLRSSDPCLKTKTRNSTSRSKTVKTRESTRPNTASSVINAPPHIPQRTEFNNGQTALFVPQAPPRSITGKVFYYTKIKKIEDKERETHLRQIQKKAFNQQIHSPFKQDMLQMRENSVRSTRRFLAHEQKQWYKERNKINKECKEAISEDYKKESRHCKKDYLTQSHPIVHILDLQS